MEFDWGTYFAVNVVLGLLSALAAKAKDRPMFPWFLTTLVFSAIALIAVLIAPRAGKRCPKCAETVKKDATVCRHCGHSFQPIPSTHDKLMNELDRMTAAGVTMVTFASPRDERCTPLERQLEGRQMSIAEARQLLKTQGDEIPRSTFLPEIRID